MLNRTDKVLIALTVLICLWGLMSLAGCEKSTPNEDTPQNARVAQVEAEKALKDAMDVLDTR